MTIKTEEPSENLEDLAKYPEKKTEPEGEEEPEPAEPTASEEPSATSDTAE